MTSVPYPAPEADVDDDMRLPDDDSLTVRLRGLGAQHLLDAMHFLAWWAPSAFNAVVAYCEATVWYDDIDPDLIPDPEDLADGGASDPAPVCGRCGGDLGIFLKLGLGWWHYRGTGLDDIELYDPGHPAEVAWRYPATATGAAPEAA